MRAIAFLLAVLLGGAAFVFWQAAAQISVGAAWAHSACSASPMFCHHPEYLAYAAGAVLIAAIGAQIGSMST